MRRASSLILFCCFCFAFTIGGRNAAAQDRTIGAWRALFPYNIVQGVATDGTTLYTAGDKSFFTYNTATSEYELYSKVDGMHDVNPTAIGWDDMTGTAIIAYQNSNIDLFHNHSFTNIPDIKLRSFAGSKTVNHIYTDNGFAYLSTGLGIVVLNLSKPEVKETYVFSKGGQTLTNTAFTAAGAYFYAATSKGLYRSLQSSNTLQAFSTWQALDTSRNFIGLAAVGMQVFAASADTLYSVTANILQPVYGSPGHLRRLDAGAGSAYLSVYYPDESIGNVDIVSATTLQITDSLAAGSPNGAADAAGGIWVADLFRGLASYDAANNVQLHIPNGPATYTSFDIIANNRDVWVAHGGYDGFYNPAHNRYGLSHLSDDSWTPYTSHYSLFGDTVQDVVALARDPQDGTLYAGTMNSGLVAIHTDGSGQIYKQGALEDPYSATSAAFDQNNNLWVTNSGAAHQLAVRTPAGQWYNYSVQATGAKYHAAAGLIVDDANQKWYYGPQGGGVVAYNDNNTPDNGADDTYRHFDVGKGYGNLPSSTVLCIAKDRQNAIWVGTSDGIGIISCGLDATNTSVACEAEIRVVQYDQFADYLFHGEVVSAIAVDGANRKWIGTTNGVWLITPDGNKIVLRFTIDNSPLPSNNIQKISIDPITGDVYIGTDAGLVSYRSTATSGGETNASPILAYPNPVPSNYGGTIAIRGLVADADVRITDIAGQLIYRTKALGGQAIWNGLDYTGHRPQSGVLLIFASDKPGTQTTTGKIIYQH